MDYAFIAWSQVAHGYVVASVPDEGVLPRAEEQQSLGIQVIPLPPTCHEAAFGIH